MNRVYVFQLGQAVAFSAFLFGLGVGLAFRTKYAIALAVLGLLFLVGTASKFQKEVLWGEEDGEVH